MNSEIYRGLSETELRSKCDESCKRLLSNKEIIARILKYTVEEFFSYDVSFIRDRCIEQNQINLEQQQRAKGDKVYIPETITGRNGNSSIVGEGEFDFDVNFEALIPKDTVFEKAFFNFEGQNRYNPGYVLETRGIFYACRMISSQYGREFSDSHYDDIKKVYSVWVCMNPQVADINTVTSYSFRKTDIVGHSLDRKHSYDKITIIKICLGGNRAEKFENYTGVIRMLDVLFSNKLSADCKAKILSEEYEIPMKNIKEEIKDMCDISQFYYESGISQGLTQGIRATIQIAKKCGVSKEALVKEIKEEYFMSEEEAEKNVDKYYS